jgi:hypothetical protein
MKNLMPNFCLFQAADNVSGQFRSLDMIAVFLGLELHKVPSPDKFTFDRPLEKGASLAVIG